MKYLSRILFMVGFLNSASAFSKDEIKDLVELFTEKCREKFQEDDFPNEDALGLCISTAIAFSENGNCEILEGAEEKFICKGIKKGRSIQDINDVMRRVILYIKNFVKQAFMTQITLVKQFLKLQTIGIFV